MSPSKIVCTPVKPVQLALDISGDNPAASFPFHFYNKQWDDRYAERRVDKIVEAGFSVPRWKYPTPGPYNGSTGEERVIGWQKIQVAARNGLITFPKMCSICGATHSLQYHNNNYFRPLSARPICQSCHRTLHRRFRFPNPWLALRYRCAFDNAWFMKIGLVELTEEQSRYLATLDNPIDETQL